ncbi:MAG: AAA family ATPase [Nanoarchaeota archaeon]|nr:AAA family ATPase [Nanoarchaeota archaeon]
MIVVIITGSVGSGKTTLANALAKVLKYKHLHIDTILNKYKLKDSYDKERKCHVIDTQKLSSALAKEIKAAKENKEQGTIIDSHLAHFLPKKMVNQCIVTTCEIEKLAKRLKKRKYGVQKIKENIECEIFQVCLEEAKKKYPNRIVVDTTKGVSKTAISKLAKKLK